RGGRDREALRGAARRARRAVPGRTAGPGLMAKVLLASRNRKKLAELQRVVDAAGITGLEILGLDAVPEYPEEPETGATFEENALIKARSGVRATGLPCVADDSGISVDALNG